MLHIHYKSPLKRVYNHAGCSKHWKDFTVSLKLIDFFVYKQIYDSVITGKVNASNELNWVASMFLTSFNICFTFGMHILCVNALKQLSVFFGTRSGFFGEDRLATDVGPDPDHRSRLRQDSIFFFWTWIRTRSQNFVKNRYRIRNHFSISGVAGVCVVISYVKTWVNYGWINDCSRSLNRSRLLKFEE